MKITVITICYNAEKEIERTMKSVLEQTFEDYEYIIVDGKSTDKTMEIAKRVLPDYPGKDVKIISEPDKGIYDAMNKGLKQASGEWVCMMNAGDCFASDNVLSEVFSSPIDKNISFLYSDLYKMTSYGKIFQVNMTCDEHTRRLVHQCIIYRKKLHNEYGYYAVTPKLIVSDYLFFLQIPLEKIRKVDTPIAIYEGSGISESGTWCKKQCFCADVVFRHRDFWAIYFDYITWRIKTCLPKKIRERIRLALSGVHTDSKYQGIENQL